MSRSDRSATQASSSVLVGFSAEQRNGIVKIRLEGELDLSSAPEVERRVRGLSEPLSTTIFDLSGLTFMDCSGLRVFIDADERALGHGAQIAIDGCRDLPQKVFSLTRHEHLLDPARVASAIADSELGPERSWIQIDEPEGRDGP